MWVFCCGMNRAGSTVQYQLAAEIVRAAGLGRGVGYIEPHQFPDLQAQYDASNGLCVVKCHYFFDEAAQLLREGEAKGVYVYRDVRDVVVSFMHKYKRSFWFTATRALLLRMLTNYRLWTGCEGILVSRYETMVSDLRKETARIAGHLGIPLDECALDQIGGMHSKEKQIERIRAYANEEHGSGRNDLAYDHERILHADHIYSGESQQWRTALTPLQIALVEDLAHDWLVDRGYPTTQGWWRRKAAAAVYHFHFARLLPPLRLVARCLGFRRRRRGGSGPPRPGAG